jgi:hypothetical protein
MIKMHMIDRLVGEIDVAPSGPPSTTKDTPHVSFDSHSLTSWPSRGSGGYHGPSKEETDSYKQLTFTIERRMTGNDTDDNWDHLSDMLEAYIEELSKVDMSTCNDEVKASWSQRLDAIDAKMKKWVDNAKWKWIVTHANQVRHTTNLHIHSCNV